MSIRKRKPAAVRKADRLGAQWSPAIGRPGPLEITARDCVLCGPGRDCDCASTPFGSDEYFARLDALHGRKP